MKSRSRVLLLPGLLLLPFFAFGCAQSETALTSLRENEALRNAARAVLYGKSYDRAAIARRNNDQSALQSAAQELQKIDPLAAAEQLVSAAAQLDGRAMNTKDAAQKRALEAQSAQKYRQALDAAPNFPSRNPTLLNALGYFLAERGTTQSDFQTAEKLTRAALKIWDESVAEIEGAPMSGPVLSARKYMRAITRDSLAWALFRLKKYDEARTEQIASVKECEAHAPQLQEKVPADVYFHLGEIERALKNYSAARAQYQAALKVEPDHALTLQALRSLTPSESTPAPEIPAPSTPQLPDEDDTGELDALEGNALSAKNVVTPALDPVI